MPTYSPNFTNLVQVYKTFPLEFPQLRAVTLAQWILESGRGGSQLSQLYFNYAGLKYRVQMERFATPVFYQANDGGDYYCSFADNASFIRGFWRFLDRPPYAGWREKARTPEEYLNFIAPRYSTNPAYVDKVLNLLPEANQLLGTQANPNPQPPNTDDHDGPGTSEPYRKPAVKAFYESPNADSRNGTPISRIILHCSDLLNTQQLIARYQNPKEQRSAHYIIEKDGDIYQMVRDGDRAWHCKGVNANSIGIELIATRNDVMTIEQNTAVVMLIRWMLGNYRIRPDQITGHRHTPGYLGGINGTFCPGRLFGDATDAALKRWVSQNFWASPPSQPVAWNNGGNPNPNPNTGNPWGGWNF